MSRQVLPQPPSPTTTNFLEKAGGAETLALVAAVASEKSAVSEVMFVLIVPLLVLVLWFRVGFLLGMSEPCGGEL
jgi:hypothetical protein